MIRLIDLPFIYNIPSLPILISLIRVVSSALNLNPESAEIHIKTHNWLMLHQLPLYHSKTRILLKCEANIYL